MNKRTLSLLFGIDMTTSIVLFILTLSSFKIETVNAQTIGDYRFIDNTASTSGWSTASKWQRWNGTEWIKDPTQGYPGNSEIAETVTIKNGKVVQLDVSPAYSIKNLIMDSISSLVIGALSVPQTTLTIAEDITVNAGTTLTTRTTTEGTHTLTIGGNIIDNGTIDFTTGSVVKTIFNGTADQSISGTATIAFDTLILDKSGSNLNIDVIGNVLINHNLDFSSDGLLIVGSTCNIVLAEDFTKNGVPYQVNVTRYNSNRYIQLDGNKNNTNSTLIKASRAAENDWVMAYPIGTATGGYTPITITDINNPPTGTDSKTLAVKSIVTGDSSNRLKRLFLFSVTGNGTNNTYLNKATFSYFDSDVSSGDIESNYNTVWKYQSGTWSKINATTYTTGTVASAYDISANTFSITNGSTEATPLLTNGTYYYTFGADFSPAPLPISLLYFTGNTTEDGVKLKWKTSTEINNDHFVIEKSATGENFLPITTIIGHGTSHEMHDYSWMDNKPTSGKTYYRLKQVDYDGAFTYSKIIVVNGINVPMNLSVYPNPIKGNEFTAELSGIKNRTHVPLEIYNLLGKKLFSVALPVNKSLETAYGTISTEILPNGIYLIKAGTGLVKKVIVAR